MLIENILLDVRLEKDQKLYNLKGFDPDVLCRPPSTVVFCLNQYYAGAC